VVPMSAFDVPRIASELSVSEGIDHVRSAIVDWVDASSPEIREMLRWQLLARSKYFRPLTLFSCWQATHVGQPPEAVLRAAVGLELVHNVSLVIDDIVDRSRVRRGRATLHCRFGELRALMVAGYLAAGAFEITAGDPYTVRLLATLLKRLGVAECVQWRLRRHPLGVEDWRAIAGEDTGSMFETCARLGSRDDSLATFGRLLGMLYHGCDDVSDVRGLAALGGGGEEDIRDGILTLPAAFAIRDPRTALMFREQPQRASTALLRRFVEALPDAESYLDQLADEARRDIGNLVRPEPLERLVAFVRDLSRN